MDRRTGRILALILLGAFLLRIGFWASVVGFHAAPRGDEIDYQRLATSIASGRGYAIFPGHPTARRPPLYPIVLGGAYSLFGTKPEVGRALQVLLGVIVVWLTFLLSSSIFSKRVALLSAALAALNPYLVFISAYLLTENLYSVLILLSLVIFARAEGRPSYFSAVIFGVVLGLGALQRPTAFPFFMFATAGLLFFGGGALSLRLSKAALAGLAFSLVLAPWALRNHARLGTWVFFTTHGGISFYQGNNRFVVEVPKYQGGVTPLYVLPGWDRLKEMEEVERDKEAWRMGRSFVAKNRHLVPGLVARKFARFWRLRSEMGLSGVKSGWWWDKGKVMGRLASSYDFGLAYSILAVPFFIAGLVLTALSYRKLFLLYGIVIVHTMVALVFFGSLRSRIPVEPVMAVFASVAIWRGVDWVRSSKKVIGSGG